MGKIEGLNEEAEKWNTTDHGSYIFKQGAEFGYQKATEAQKQPAMSLEQIKEVYAQRMGYEYWCDIINDDNLELEEIYDHYDQVALDLVNANQFREEQKWVECKHEPKAGIIILVCDFEKKWHSTAKYMHKKYYADDDIGAQIYPTHWQYLNFPNE